MPLSLCPWMGARCPHYKATCHDADSIHCLYVKTSTSTARAALAQLLASRRILGASDPAVDQSIRELQDFLAGKDD